MSPLIPEWVTFDALESWKYPKLRTYTYQYISDERIQQVVDEENLSTLALTENWWDHTANDESAGADNPVHPLRVAKLALLFAQDFGNVKPIEIIAEDDVCELCGYCVTDGHHRLRALKFLGRTKFPAILMGQSQALDQLRLLTGSV